MRASRASYVSIRSTSLDSTSGRRGDKNVCSLRPPAEAEAAVGEGEAVVEPKASWSKKCETERPDFSTVLSAALRPAMREPTVFARCRRVTHATVPSMLTSKTAGASDEAEEEVEEERGDEEAASAADSSMPALTAVHGILTATKAGEGEAAAAVEGCAAFFAFGTADVDLAGAAVVAATAGATSASATAAVRAAGAASAGEAAVAVGAAATPASEAVFSIEATMSATRSASVLAPSAEAEVEEPSTAAGIPSLGACFAKSISAARAAISSSDGGARASSGLSAIGAAVSATRVVTVSDKTSPSGTAAAAPPLAISAAAAEVEAAAVEVAGVVPTPRTLSFSASLLSAAAAVAVVEAAGRSCEVVPCAAAVMASSRSKGASRGSPLAKVYSSASIVSAV